MNPRYDEVFEHFLCTGVIGSVGCAIKSGKEAEVWRCTPGDAVEAAGKENDPNRPRPAVAVKIYKDIEERSFRDMSAYLDGRIGRSIRGRRDILHMFSNAESMQAGWVEAEYEALSRLSARGLPVPRPFERTGRALAMELVEDECGEGACQLVHCRLPEEAKARMYDDLVDVLIEMLRLDLIHGDLSPYNVLVRGGQPVIIDFPQAIDARFHSQAYAMFSRDFRNLSSWFEKAGVRRAREAESIASEAWELYERNRL